ncbi:MAG: hypothetical protein BWY06_03437 [Candidatus Latescibacteria bacterium ADurb.Bin168]|nr:MAG: hypothetical protein BWY06_03437 [Candidatus Latescibacteria bacterium ADurb.Bin168]
MEGTKPPAAPTEPTRRTVVVFPFVPVTPTSAVFLSAFPYQAMATTASALRTSGTTIWGTASPSICTGVSTAEAPCSHACAANLHPSTFEPGNAQKRAPLRAVRESVTMQVSGWSLAPPPTSTLPGTASAIAFAVHGARVTGFVPFGLLLHPVTSALTQRHFHRSSQHPRHPHPPQAPGIPRKAYPDHLVPTLLPLFREFVDIATRQYSPVRVVHPAEVPGQ